MIMSIPLFALLLASQAQAPQAITRSPSDALIEAVDLCPLYLRSGGINEAEEARLRAEFGPNSGVAGELRHNEPPVQIMMMGAPTTCVVVLTPREDASTDVATPIVEQAASTLLARLQRPDSGWSPLPENPERGLRFRNALGLELAVSATTDEGLLVLVSEGSPESTFGQDARRAADIRPTDQALMNAIDTLCRVPLAQIHMGEVGLRHAGEGRLTVRYVLNGDCGVDLEGGQPAAVLRALVERLDAPASDWTRVRLAYLPTGPNPGLGGADATWAHTDGRLLVALLEEDNLQVITWTAPDSVENTNH